MRLTILTAVACFSVVTLCVADSSLAAAKRQPITIPPQQLGIALQTLAQERDFQIICRGELVRELRTPGVQGNYTPLEALQQLLSGTGLTYRELDDNTVTVIPLSSSVAAGSSNTEQPTIAPRSRLHLAGANQETPSSAAAMSSPEASSPQRTSQDSQVEEVVVTAQKRPERLIETPQSVSVLPADALSKLGATQFRDFANTLPGLSFQTAGAGTTQITLRGVTTGFDVTPTTGVYVDEVPYGSSTAFAQGAQAALDVGLFDLDRVEVLRGPQGTLYGASTMGGLIKYVTVRPDLQTLGGDVTTGVSGTQHGSVNYNVAATLNAPVLTDTLAVRASGYESHDGGYLANVARHESNVNQSDVYGGRLDLLYKPTEVFSARITGFLQNISRDGEATANYTSTGAEPYGDLGQYRPFAEPFEQQFRLLGATLGYDFGRANLTSISSYQTTELSSDWDISARYVPLLQAALGRTYSAVSDIDRSGTDKFTQELRLASPGKGVLEWVIGGFYTHETSRYAEEFILRDVAGEPAPNDLYTFSLSSRYSEYAVFGDLTWHLTDRFSVTGGMRYAHNDQESTQFGAGLFIGPRPLSRSSDDVKTYLANTRYMFTDHVVGYLRYATGYRPGGPNLAGNNPATGKPLGPPTFQADRLKSYEGGLKAETADRRFGIDMAAYYIDWSNIQVLGINGGFALRENVPGGAHIRGTELTVTARPVDGLTLSGSFAYQDAKLAAASPDIGGADGERLPNVPRFTGSTNADYLLSDSRLHPTIGATVRAISDRTASFDNSPNFPQYHLPGYITVDLRAAITMNSINCQLYAHNVTDRRGQISDMLPQFGTRIGIIQPRTIGVNLSKQF